MMGSVGVSEGHGIFENEQRSDLPRDLGSHHPWMGVVRPGEQVASSQLHSPQRPCSLILGFQ